MIRRLTFAVLCLAQPTLAWSHEGHGVPGHGNTVSHYLLDPWHLPLMLIIVGLVLVTLTAIQGRSARSMRP